VPKELINPFYKDLKEYKRDFYPLKHYIHQASYYLSLMTGIDVKIASNWIKTKLKNGEFEKFQDPIVEYLLRGDNFDRELVEQPLSQMLRDVIVNKEILAPSLTTYVNETVEDSLISQSLATRVEDRNVAKRAMFAAEAAETMATMEGRVEDAKKHHMEWFFSEKTQAATKISNNSVSGMNNSAGNPLFNPTGHSTLTSNCRMTAGFGNANNEKLVSGNRHYWSPTVTLANVVAIVSNSNYEEIGKFVRENNFHIPSVDETMQVIDYSAKLYWKDSVQRQKIVDLVEKLNDLQRCAFVYTGDLYHIRKFNEGYVRQFFSRIIRKVEDDLTPRTAKDIKALLEDHVLWAHHICAAEMKGRGKDYKAIEGTKELSILYATAYNVSKTLHDYRDFITTFFMTNNIPASVPRFPDSIRRSAMVSDTDSTIFSAQEWVRWYHGKITFSDEAVALGASVVAFAAQSIDHVLTLYSANAGIAEKKLKLIGMKNEFYFPILVPTRVAKHYFATISIQEGNVKGDFEFEIKGVHLKSSNAPKFINDEAKSIMKHIMMSVIEGKMISMVELLKRVAAMEHRVYESLMKGESDFYRGGQIKTLDSYKGRDTPGQTNYIHYLLWKECFAQKYGDIMEPPYAVIKISTAIDSVAKTAKWLEGMADQELANRLRAFLKKYEKNYFGTFWLPQSYVNQYGLPEEFKDAIDIRHMVADVCKVFYIILETLGYYGLNSKESNLVYDYWEAPKTVEDDDGNQYLKLSKLNEELMNVDDETRWHYDDDEIDEDEIFAE
jgi:hypothetical protein